MHKGHFKSPEMSLSQYEPHATTIHIPKKHLWTIFRWSLLRPINQIIREDSDTMKLAARKEAIQETQCYVEHQEGNKDGIKQEGAALVPDIYLCEDSSNVESATEEKRRRSWQTKLRTWSSRSSKHAEKTNPWNDGLVSTSKLHPLRESENDVFENDPTSRTPKLLQQTRRCLYWSRENYEPCQAQRNDDVFVRRKARYL